ncbi:MAG: hypothetical protein GTO03_12755, partial [Planctomycetales bacterium]|nr:hypothetical protein [Planctomycetales bacterium]
MTTYTCQDGVGLCGRNCFAKLCQALQAAWKNSLADFDLQNPGLAAVEIWLLWVAILATVIAFWKRSNWAGGLLVPYLAWVSFAAVRNVAIWQMNVQMDLRLAGGAGRSQILPLG